MWVFSRVRAGVVVGAAALLAWGCSSQPNFVAKHEPWRADEEQACLTSGAIREKAEFASATRQKLLLEISRLEPPPSITRVQDPPKMDCMVGEQLWRQYFDDRFRE